MTVCESHSVAGGAAHTFTRGSFHFESGPSLYSQLSPRPSGNPLSQVLHALDVPLPCVQYNTWHVHVPEGSFVTEVGNDQFVDCLRRYVDDDAAREWQALVAHMQPLSASATAVPAVAARTDAAALLTLARFLPRMFSSGGNVASAQALLRPYSEYISGKVRHPFLKNWLDLLCFLLSGATASGTLAAEIGYMFADWYRPGACLEYPLGGSKGVVDALLSGLSKYNGTLHLNAHVDNILVSGDGAERRATGVRLRDGRTINARTAVISNASIWDTLPLLPANALPASWRQRAAETEQCDSFMHLHLGIDAAGLPPSLEAHHISIEDWTKGVTAPQNLVLVSIASIFDPSLAPPGCHVIHAYTPATEPYSLWKDVDPKCEAYKALKAERSEVLWRAVEKAIPDVRRRVKVQMTGTPRTHARYLRRANGTYGGTGWLGDESQALPTAETPLPGLLCVGDSMFPGPGVPAVAASGMAAAHALVPWWQQCQVLDLVAP